MIKHLSGFNIFKKNIAFNKHWDFDSYCSKTVNLWSVLLLLIIIIIIIMPISRWSTISEVKIDASHEDWHTFILASQT